MGTPHEKMNVKLMLISVKIHVYLHYAHALTRKALIRISPVKEKSTVEKPTRGYEDIRKD